MSSTAPSQPDKYSSSAIFSSSELLMLFILGTSMKSSTSKASGPISSTGWYTELICCCWMQAVSDSSNAWTTSRLSAPLIWKKMCVLLSRLITTSINRRKTYGRRGLGLSPISQGIHIVPSMLFWKSKKTFPLCNWGTPLCPHYIQALPQVSPDICFFL